jgi:hypothetical protein
MPVTLRSFYYVKLVEVKDKEHKAQEQAASKGKR